MNGVKIVAETDETVTISREDWRRLQEALENAGDRTAIAERRAYERLVGKETARRDYLTAGETIRLLDGQHPVKLWREKRGLTQRALAGEAGIGSSYVAEIETNRKPGSDDALRKLAAVLHVPPEDLDARRYRTRDPQYGPVVLRGSCASSGVSPGSRGSWVLPMNFPTLRDALDFVRDGWATLRSRDPWIANADHWPIYTTEELFLEIEG